MSDAKSMANSWKPMWKPPVGVSVLIGPDGLDAWDRWWHHLPMSLYAVPSGLTVWLRMDASLRAVLRTVVQQARLGYQIDDAGRVTNSGGYVGDLDEFSPLHDMLIRLPLLWEAKGGEQITMEVGDMAPMTARAFVDLLRACAAQRRLHVMLLTRSVAILDQFDRDRDSIYEMRATGPARIGTLYDPDYLAQCSVSDLYLRGEIGRGAVQTNTAEA